MSTSIFAGMVFRSRAASFLASMPKATAENMPPAGADLGNNVTAGPGRLDRGGEAYDGAPTTTVLDLAERKGRDEIADPIHRQTKGGFRNYFREYLNSRNYFLKISVLINDFISHPANHRLTNRRRARYSGARNRIVAISFPCPITPRSDHEFNKTKAMDWLETEVVDWDVLIDGGMAGRGTSCEAAFWAKENGLRAVACARGGATDIRRPHAVGEGGVSPGSHAIGPSVDENWPTLG